MVSTAQQGRTWQERADMADRAREGAALDRLRDDAMRYEPTPLVEPPDAAPTALIAVVLLAAAGFVAAAFVVWAVWG